VNSGTLIRNMRTHDSSEFVTAKKQRDLSDKKVIISPFLPFRENKSSSHAYLKPKLKIVKNKESKNLCPKTIRNPFKKPFRRDSDYSLKISGISPNSKLKTSDIYKEKKYRKKSGHKRSGSQMSGTKSHALLG
jgi:hypothetical protein